jgi:hypothetical protein
MCMYRERGRQTDRQTHTHTESRALITFGGTQPSSLPSSRACRAWGTPEPRATMRSTLARHSCISGTVPIIFCHISLPVSKPCTKHAIKHAKPQLMGVGWPQRERGGEGSYSSYDLAALERVLQDHDFGAQLDRPTRRERLAHTNVHRPSAPHAELSSFSRTHHRAVRIGPTRMMIDTNEFFSPCNPFAFPFDLHTLPLRPTAVLWAKKLLHDPADGGRREEARLVRALREGVICGAS